MQNNDDQTRSFQKKKKKCEFFLNISWEVYWKIY